MQEIDVDVVLTQLLPAKLISIFQSCNNVTAAKAAADQLEKLLDQSAIDQHRAIVEGLKDPIDVARHYGHLDLPKKDLRADLGGRELTDAEAKAYEEGRRTRSARDARTRASPRQAWRSHRTLDDPFLKGENTHERITKSEATPST